MRTGWGFVGAGVLGLLGIYLAAVWTTEGQRADLALTAMVRADEELATRLRHLLTLVGPWTTVPLALGVVLVGTALRGWRTGVAAAAGVAVCLVTPQVLKPLLPRPELAVSWPLPNSLPSGHTAAVIAVTVALLLVVPPRWRGPVLLAGALTSAMTGLLMVALPHHRVSDVLASGAVGLLGYGVALVVRWATTSTKT